MISRMRGGEKLLENYMKKISLKERRANNIKHAENRNVYVARRSIRRGVLSLEQEIRQKRDHFRSISVCLPSILLQLKW